MAELVWTEGLPPPCATFELNDAAEVLAHDGTTAPLGIATLLSRTYYGAGVRPRLRLQLQPSAGSGSALQAATVRAVASRAMPRSCLRLGLQRSEAYKLAQRTSAGDISVAGWDGAVAPITLSEVPLLALGPGGIAATAVVVGVDVPADAFDCNESSNGSGGGTFFHSLFVQLELQVDIPGMAAKYASVGSAAARSTVEGGCTYLTMLATCHPDACARANAAGEGDVGDGAFEAALEALERALGRQLPRGAALGATAACVATLAVLAALASRMVAQGLQRGGDWFVRCCCGGTHGACDVGGVAPAAALAAALGGELPAGAGAVRPSSSSCGAGGARRGLPCAHSGASSVASSCPGSPRSVSHFAPSRLGGSSLGGSSSGAGDRSSVLATPRQSGGGLRAGGPGCAVLPDVSLLRAAAVAAAVQRRACSSGGGRSRTARDSGNGSGDGSGSNSGSGRSSSHGSGSRRTCSSTGGGAASRPWQAIPAAVVPAMAAAAVAVPCTLPMSPSPPAQQARSARTFANLPAPCPLPPLPPSPTAASPGPIQLAPPPPPRTLALLPNASLDLWL